MLAAQLSYSIEDDLTATYGESCQQGIDDRSLGFKLGGTMEPVCAADTLIYPHQVMLLSQLNLLWLKILLPMKFITAVIHRFVAGGEAEPP